jgi:membrane-associated protein
LDLIHQFLSIFTPEGIRHLIEWGGLLAICIIIFAETGFFAILPGDSLLVLSGILAASSADGKPGLLSLWALLIVVPICAIVGDQVGFWIGGWFGNKMYTWKDKHVAGIPVFKPAWLKRTHEFSQRWGVFFLVAGRWVPIVRTFAPIVAGIGRMPFMTFTTFNAIGGVTWVWSMVLLGYFLGTWAENHGFPLAKHIDKVAVVIVFLSVLPIAWTVYKERKHSKGKPSDKAPAEKKAPAKPVKKARKK